MITRLLLFGVIHKLALKVITVSYLIILNGLVYRHVFVMDHDP